MLLDLTPAEQALADLLGDVTGHSAGEIMEEAGAILQSQWRDRISSSGLVDTGRYLESIAVTLLHADEKGAWVKVGTDNSVNIGRRGMPYPVALEYGWENNEATPTGARAFAASRRQIVADVSSAIGTKIKARKVRKTKRKG